MKQHGYHAEHHGTGGEQRLEAGPLSSAPQAPIGGHSNIAQPDPEVDDGLALRFLEHRKLRRLDLDGTTPLTLRVAGRVMGIVQPGENVFNPPIPFEPGDTLQLEPIAPNDSETKCTLSGWVPASPLNPCLPLNDQNDVPGGCHV